MQGGARPLGRHRRASRSPIARAAGAACSAREKCPLAACPPAPIRAARRAFTRRAKPQIRPTCAVSIRSDASASTCCGRLALRARSDGAACCRTPAVTGAESLFQAPPGTLPRQPRQVFLRVSWRAMARYRDAGVATRRWTARVPAVSGPHLGEALTSSSAVRAATCDGRRVFMVESVAEREGTIRSVDVRTSPSTSLGPPPTASTAPKRITVPAAGSAICGARTRFDAARLLQRRHVRL